MLSGMSSSSSGLPHQAKRDFFDVAGEIFAENALPPAKLHKIVSNAQKAGAQGGEKVVAAGAQGKHLGNLHRDLMRTFMKRSPWQPGIYEGRLPVLDKKTGEVVEMDWPFLLPHEVLSQVLAACPAWAPEVQPAETGNYAFLWKASSSFADQFGFQVEHCIPLGIHADGIPYKAKQKDSIVCVSWNFAASSSPKRFFITCYPHSVGCGRRTYDAIWSLIAWSFRTMAMGVWPTCRDRGDPFGTSRGDAMRAKRAGQPFPFVGCLTQIRGDWEFYRDGVQMPAWNRHDMMCWKCRATNQNFADLSPTGPWQTEAITGLEFLARQVAAGDRPSALWSVPGMKVQIINGRGGNSNSSGFKVFAWDKGGLKTDRVWHIAHMGARWNTAASIGCTQLIWV